MSSDESRDPADEIAIEMSGVSKIYPIFEKPQHRLLQGLLRGRKQFYREFQALHDVSLSVRRGESVGIIGRNGAGKSTLLQIICGILQPSSGAARIKGRVAALLELGTGFNPEFTGRENVVMSASVLGLSSDEIAAKYDDIVAFADIGEYIEQPVKTYSSGMYVRLAFAVIAHVDADILIIDEALSVGDAFFTQKCMRFLRGFRASGTLLFVSHDIASIMNFCDKAVWLDNGRVRLTGSAEYVTTAYLQGVYEMSADQVQLESTEPADCFDEQATVLWDQRNAFINASTLRNDIEVFQFDEQCSSFGEGGGKILDVSLHDSSNRILTWVVGGEEVCLRIECQAISNLEQPVIGFFIKDRLGQYLFGENSYLTFADSSPVLGAGQRLRAQFTFAMPILPAGDYCVVAALANGDNNAHVMHHWLHEALLFKSHSSSVSTGLIGIPIDKIELLVKHG